jgi:hypothetical protein
MRFTVLSIYRGHVIVALVDEDLTAEITERASGAPLPTKVSATRDEGMDVLIHRAKTLVDHYQAARDGLGSFGRPIASSTASTF